MSTTTSFSSTYVYTLGSAILYLPDTSGVAIFTSNINGCGIISITCSCSNCIGGTLPQCITYNSAKSRVEVISASESDAA